MTTNDPTTPGATPPGDGTQPGVTPTPDGQAPNGTQPPDTSKWTIEDWKRFALDRDGAAKTANADAIEKRKKLKALEDAKAKSDSDTAAAETERLKKQGEFQTLAEQRETRVKELEPQVTALTTERDELAGILTAQLEAEIKDWPAEIKAMDPGKEAGLKARSAWRDKAKIAVEKFAPTGAPARPGNRPNPPASGGGGPKTADDYYNEMKGSGRYHA